MAATVTHRVQRCAIYTRKSTQDQWDREFNSIESQRDICSAYITCQKHRNWTKLRSYDDTAQSGATLNRPALQRLLHDVETGEIDIVVIYKIDRLTRSLADFIRLIQLFDDRHVKFVAVTQSFDTSDSMGRLVLNILLTFAQFERELIADRLRDKVAAIKRRGKINGGKAPYGYDIVDGRLVVNVAEAELVRSIFRRYLEVGSCGALSRQMKDEGVKAKLHVTRAGVVRGGGPASNGMLYHILKNPIYVGRVPHNGDSYPGEHEAIVDEATWEAARALIAKRRKFGPGERQPRNFLNRLLRDSQGRKMVHTTSGKKQYRYYQSVPTPWLERDGIKRFRIRAEHIEELVLAAVKDVLSDRERIRGALRELGRRPEELELLTRGAARACANLETASPERLREALRSLLIECEISPQSLILVFRSTEVARFLTWDGIALFEGDRAAWTPNEPTFAVRRALDEVRFGRRVEVPVEPISFERRGMPNSALVSLIQTARQAQAAMDDEADAEIKTMALRFKCSPQRFCRLLRLNYLAPDIVAAILGGAQPPGLTLSRLVRGPLPLDWELQRRVLGFATRNGSAVPRRVE